MAINAVYSYAPGLKNAPAMLQSGMSLVLKGLIETKCIVYIDDIFVFGEKKEEFEANMRDLESRLFRHGLKINKEKSIFNKEEVTFIGYVIKHNYIKSLPIRSEGIKNFPEPVSKKQLRKFLGLLNYDRIFVKGLVDITKTLYELLKSTGNKIKLYENENKN